MDKIVELLLSGPTNTAMRTLGLVALIYFASVNTNDLASIKEKIAHIEALQNTDHQVIEKLEDVFFRADNHIPTKGEPYHVERFANP